MTTYHTTFPNTQNPILDNWITGLTTGLDWTDPETTPGKCFGTQSSGSSFFDDSIACRPSGFLPDIEVTYTVALDGTLNSGTHETEGLLRFSITPHDARGYECNYSYGTGAIPNGPSYIQIVRWNGALGSFDFINQRFDAPGPANGTVVKCTIVGNLISVFINGILELTADITSIGGTVWSTGSPGMGFWHGDGGAHYYMTDYTATDNAAVPSSFFAQQLSL